MSNIEAGEITSLDLAILRAHPGGAEGYLIEAGKAALEKDERKLERALNDANRAGFDQQCLLPGFERGVLPGGILILDSGEKKVVPWQQAKLYEVERVVMQLRQQVNQQDAQVAQYEATLVELKKHPETTESAPLGEIVAAIETRAIGSAS